MLALVTTACPGGGRDGGVRPTPRRARTGGELVLAYPHEPATLDPFLVAGDAPATRDLVRLMMPALWRVGPGNDRRPWLLASEPAVFAGPPFTVTVVLREDAVWSDGRPITAADLRFTWRVAMDPQRRPSTRDGYDQIDDIVAETPKRARIVFRNPFRRWRDLFSSGLGVVPAHALASRKRLAALSDGWRVSGGPFVLKRWRKNLDMVFERNRRAWGGTDPLIDRLRVVFVPDSIAALELLRRGDVDLLGPYHASEWTRRASSVAGVSVSSDHGATRAAILLNTGASPLHQRRVRRAFAASVDVRRIVGAIVGTEGCCSPARAQDLREARSLLDAAGWRGSGVRRRAGRRLSFTLAVVGADPLSGVVVRAVQRQAARTGFDVHPVALDADVFWRAWLPGRGFRAALVLWREAPEGSGRAWFGATGSGKARVPNRARLQDPVLDRALAAEDRALGPGARPGTSVGRLARLVASVTLYEATVSVAGGPRAGGVCASAAADGPLWAAHDWFVGRPDPDEPCRARATGAPAAARSP